MNSNESLLTTKQLAAQLNCSVRAVQLWTKAHKLPVIRLTARCVRYDPRAVQEALKRHTVRAVE